VIDVEAGLMSAVEQDRAGTVAAVGRFMTRVKPLTPFLAYSTMAVASDYPDMLYSELNGYCDVFMPQVYFTNTETALYLLDRMQASVDYESASWPDPPKPMIPVVNDWGDGVDIDQLRSYIEIAFARYGAVSAWRLHPNMQQEVKDLWGDVPRMRNRIAPGGVRLPMTSLARRATALLAVAGLTLTLFACSTIGVRPSITPPPPATSVATTSPAATPMATSAEATSVVTGTIYPQTFDPNATPTPVPPQTPFPTPAAAGRGRSHLRPCRSTRPA